VQNSRYWDAAVQALSWDGDTHAPNSAPALRWAPVLDSRGDLFGATRSGGTVRNRGDGVRAGPWGCGTVYQITL
jgi:hypothetical protein